MRTDALKNLCRNFLTALELLLISFLMLTMLLGLVFLLSLSSSIGVFASNLVGA